MKLQRIALQNVRMFRDAVALGDLEPGLNVFTGPNGTGKSTLVYAIRAAFLERHKASTVDDLLPRDTSGVAPTIKLDFTVGDTPYRLEKSFLATKRCSLSFGRDTLDGEDAEDHLARLIGYGYAGRGSSQDKNWGIPGLLWVEQGTGHKVHDQVGFADSHLQAALQSLVGSVASTGGDAVIESLATQRDALVSGSRKDPRGPYATAKTELAACAAQLQDLDDRIVRYRGQVDELARLQATVKQLESDRPWEQLESQRSQALAGLEEAERLQETMQVQEARRDEARVRATLFTTRLSELREPEALLAKGTARLDEANEALERLQARSAQVQADHAAAEHNLEQATTALQHAQDAAAHADLTAQQVRIVQQQATLQARHTQALEAKEQVEARQSEAAAGRLETSELETIRERATELSRAEVRLEAVSTRVRYDLDPGIHLAAGEATLAGEGELRVTEPVAIALPGLGRLEIRPGGDDLETLVSRRASAEAALAAALADAGVGSLKEAEAKAEAYRAARHAADVARSALSAAAPDGIQAIVDDLERLGDDHDAIVARLAAIPALVATALPLADAKDAEQHARNAMSLANEERTRQQQQLRELEIARDQAAQSVAELQARVDSSSRLDEIRSTDAMLIQAQADTRDAAAQLASLQTQAAALDADQLKLDAARFDASAKSERSRFESTRDRTNQLRAEIQHVGADGLEEQQAQLQVKHAALAQRVAEFARQVDVITHLLGILERRRDAVQQQLLAPLQAKVDHYLRLIFPDQQLVMDAGLVPGGLQTRAGRNAGDYDEQSYGTREQLGLVCRFAYADLLREAGSPTLLVLDDALVHTDSERLDLIKRVIFDAAQRHQILLMTCHPDRWRDAGVPVRELAVELRPAA